MNFRRLVQRGAPLLVAIPLLCLTSGAAASDMELTLQVKAGEQVVSTERTYEQPSETKPQPRAVFTSRGAETLVVTWTVKNTGEEEKYEDVLIHCFVVREEEAGQENVPDLADPVQESALTMDFKPGGSASGEFSLIIDKPGAYLVRVETRNMLATHGHEHYAALDLVRE